MQIQFFVLAPVLHKLIKDKSIRTNIILIVILTLMSIFCHFGQTYLPDILSKLLEVTVIPYLYFLVLGMIVWYRKEDIIPMLSKHRWALLTGYVLWKFAEMYLQFTHVVDGVLYNSVTTILLACVMFGFAFEHKWRVSRDYSYGIYLYHMVFVNLAIQMGFESLEPIWEGMLLLVSIFALTICSAWLSQKFIERPIIRMMGKKG